MFTAADLDVLRAHDLAVHRGKIIVAARPPITPAEITEVERRLTGPIPEALLRLWCVAFGGELDYDLTVGLGEHRYSASLGELFWPGSDGYRDLWGWMDYDLELFQEVAERRGQPPPTRLGILPFGGFEYLERVYVPVAGDDQGTVLLWAQGLPPNWKMRLNEDTSAPIAANVDVLFDQLELKADPFEPGDVDYPRGLRIVEAVDVLREEHPQLAAKLDALIRGSVFDWRGVIAAGRYDGTQVQQRAGAAALASAASYDDVDLVRLLLERGYPVDEVVHATSNALAVAVARGSHRVASALVDCEVPLGDTVIVYTCGLTPELVDKLLGKGVAFDIEAVLSIAADGELDSAQRIVTSGRRTGEWGDVATELVERARREEQSARKVEAGSLASSTTPVEHRRQSLHLRRLAKQLSDST